MQEWKYRHEAVGKGTGWKMWEWKNRHGNAGIAGGGKMESKCVYDNFKIKHRGLTVTRP